MRDLACRLRANQLYYHNAHNFIDGENFFGDHDFFADAYKASESAYDSVIERILGMGQGGELQMTQFHHEVASKLETAPAYEAENPEEYFRYALKVELAVIQIVGAYVRSGECTVGTENMLAAIADEAEQRLYKIQSRLQKHED